MTSLGILVCGDNHFIVRGVRPSREVAIGLARHWSIIQIGGSCPPELAGWTIVERAFREDLAWGVVVGDSAGMSAAVGVLLGEMRGRGIEIDTANAYWIPRPILL